jgi:predicted pyridoxine 5'-phosphate oxidase superfamily flavin-nucleotide-binding protein
MTISRVISSTIGRCKFVTVGTSDKSGRVHLATARGIKVLDDTHIVFEEWFCHGTLENLNTNPRITIGFFAAETGQGYQLLGEVEEVHAGAVLDGFSQEEEDKWSHLPQSRQQLYTRVDSILELATGPHSDKPIE